jgi:CheY-like chemotaxis protein
VPLVLAIEPDLRQAAIVKRIVREKVHADVAVVDSRDAALQAISQTVPDVLLISALLSPRDEDELVAHLRTLAALTKPGGRAVLVTDLCESSVFPPGRPRSEANLGPLMTELVDRGHVIYSSHPGMIHATLDDDPVLKRAFSDAELSAPWLWQNGPEHRFLVYALALPRK